eukprot:340853_1
MVNKDKEFLRFVSSKGCYKSPIPLFTAAYIITWIVLCITIVLFISSLYQFYCIKKKNRKLDKFITNYKNQQWIYFIVFLFYMISILLILLGFSSAIFCWQQTDNSFGLVPFFWLAGTSLHYIALSTLYLFCLIRIHSIFHIQQYLFIILCIGYIIQIFCQLYTFATMYIARNSNDRKTTMERQQQLNWRFSALFINIFFNVTLIIIFIIKIRRFIKNEKEITKKIKIITIRYFVLSVTAITSSIISCTFWLTRVYGTNTMNLLTASFISINIDALLNILCVYLQFPFADRLYQIMCCTNKLQTICFESDVDIDKEIKMDTMIHVHTQSQTTMDKHTTDTTSLILGSLSQNKLPQLQKDVTALEYSSK